MTESHLLEKSKQSISKGFPLSRKRVFGCQHGLTCTQTVQCRKQGTKDLSFFTSCRNGKGGCLVDHFSSKLFTLTPKKYYNVEYFGYVLLIKFSLLQCTVTSYCSHC